MDFKRKTISQRITTGFGVVLVLLVVIGVCNYFGIGTIVHNAREVIYGNKLTGILAQKEIDHLIWVSKVNALLTDKKVTDLTVETDPHKCGFGQWYYSEERQTAERMVPSLAPLLAALEEPHNRLHQSAVAIKAAFVQADPELNPLLVGIEAGHLEWAGKVRDGLLTGNASQVEVDPARCGLGKWLDSDAGKQAYQHGSAQFKKVVDAIREPHRQMHESVAQVNELLKAGKTAAAIESFKDNTKKYLDATTEDLWQLEEMAAKDMEGMEKAKVIYAEQCLPNLRKVQELFGQLREESHQHLMSDETMANAAKMTKVVITALSLVAIALGLFLAFFIARGVSVLLRNIVERMASGADQVATAAMQISGTSQTLADGASEQAASVEETSASVEEVSAMIRQDADNAREADKLMKDAGAVLREADESMGKLTRSMHEIAGASAETQKIVKTIDEIAFQTNLLALNAAVEAARAGEAGAGFAVVADEVRNLALRAAKAAKDTSQLIDGTVQKVTIGSGQVDETSKSFSEATRAVEKLGTLVSEIAGSTSQQAQAIGQLTKAIAQIDSITQMNAANAEESASASEELSGQAGSMNQVVQELVGLVGGQADKHNSARGVTSGGSSGALKMLPRPAPRHEALRSQKALPAGDGPRRKAARPAERPSRAPEEVIPMDDSEFENF